MKTQCPIRVMTATLMLMSATVAHAQDAERKEPASRRTRVSLGPQLVPSYPGSDNVSLRPLIDIARAPAGEPFEFEAPDESFGFPLVRTGGFSFGPSLGIEGKRDAEDIGAQLPETGFSFEVGAFAQQELGTNFRLRAEARQGVSGHEGFLSILSADYFARDGLRQEFSIGPRLTITDNRYQDAYFSVLPEDSAVAGLPAYDAAGGLQAVGAAAGYIRQFTPRWGIYSFVKYDRLVGDAADSPIVTALGSRDQFSGGIALSYSFGAVAP
jgi:outer membrane protein